MRVSDGFSMSVFTSSECKTRCSVKAIKWMNQPPKSRVKRWTMTLCSAVFRLVNWCCYAVVWWHTVALCNWISEAVMAWAWPCVDRRVRNARRCFHLVRHFVCVLLVCQQCLPPQVHNGCTQYWMVPDKATERLKTIMCFHIMTEFQLHFYVNKSQYYNKSCKKQNDFSYNCAVLIFQWPSCFELVHTNTKEALYRNIAVKHDVLAVGLHQRTAHFEEITLCSDF